MFFFGGGGGGCFFPLFGDVEGDLRVSSLGAAAAAAAVFGFAPTGAGGGTRFALFFASAGAGGGVFFLAFGDKSEAVVFPVTVGAAAVFAAIGAFAPA